MIGRQSNNIYISDVEGKGKEANVTIILANKINDIQTRKVLSGWNHRKNQLHFRKYPRNKIQDHNRKRTQMLMQYQRLSSLYAHPICTFGNILSAQLASPTLSPQVYG